jgi:hypothetical protein
LGLLTASVFSVLLGIAVNPVVQGLDSLYKSNISKSIANVRSNSLWASNNFAIDAILTANGKSQLSGQQLTGPNRKVWEIFDPQSKYKEFWNSGASYVGVQFVDSGEDVQISKPAKDLIQVILNPCSEVSKKLELRFIASTSDMKMGCLTKYYPSPIDYQGNKVWIYAIK